MSELLRRQWQFSRMIPALINKAHELGYEVTMGHAYRCPTCPTGNKKSLHKSRLAIDLQLFRGNEYLSESHHYADLGLWWESQGGTWGGRFGNADANHFSLEHGGMK